MHLAVVVMAAGMGTRMKSKVPKVLHPLLGRPLLGHTLAAVTPLAAQDIVVVTGHEAGQVQAALDQLDGVADLPLTFARQVPQLGTGHAVQQAAAPLAGRADTVLVVPGDLPLISTRTLQRLIDTFRAASSPVVMLTAEVIDARGFGRVTRHGDGSIAAIVEEVDCTPEQKMIREVNVGAYVFDAQWLWENLVQLPVSAKGEVYITDLVGVAVDQGHSVAASVLRDPVEVIGVNTRVHLAEAEVALRARVNRAWMLAGVTIVDPATTYIDSSVAIGQDTVIQPNTYLEGQTVIGQDCVIGPNTLVANSTVGDGCLVRFSVVESARIEDDVDIGPFAHLRKGAHLATGVHMGNFGEVKNSYLGPGTKMGHFSYLGDVTTGENVNIGAGTISCNYDGVRKHPTKIGDDAFIGSDTMLVAPVTVGARSKTGAGSVVTRDVPDDSVAYGVPARLKVSDKT
jgi:bifunctional UDP-N-acetylglucosamine pyrophosphorylase/glucosamine-1-phosphate N-acetyltransferase